MVHRIGTAGLTVLLLSCAMTGTPESHATPAGPAISSISPTSAPVGVAYPVEIVIIGEGFAETGNVVHFGSIRVGELPATGGGTRIAFMAPKQNTPTGGAPPMVLLPGRYPITVTASGKTSEPVDFELVRG